MTLPCTGAGRSDSVAGENLGEAMGGEKKGHDGAQVYSLCATGASRIR